MVSVPVLSKANTETLFKDSKMSVRLRISPKLLSLLMAAEKAVGVAKPSAQGQVATNTDTVIHNASSGRLLVQ